MAKTETGNMSNYLKGINFPAQKNDIVNAARKNNAPNDVIQQLQQMPDQRFEQQQEVQDVLQGRTMSGQGGQSNQGGQSTQGGQRGQSGQGGQSNR